MGTLLRLGLIIGLFALSNAQLVENLAAKLAVPEAEVLKEVENACIFLPDGTYAFGCTNEYIACSDGTAHLMKCSTVTVHDNVLKQCIPKEKASLCQEGTDLLPDLQDLLLESKKFIESDFMPSYDVQKDICSHGGDGYHANGCSAHYVGCVGGFPKVMTCPAKLRYDGSTKLCLAPAKAVSCAANVPAAVSQLIAKLQNRAFVKTRPLAMTKLAVIIPTETALPPANLVVTVPPPAIFSMVVPSQETVPPVNILVTTEPPTTPPIVIPLQTTVPPVPIVTTLSPTVLSSPTLPPTVLSATAGIALPTNPADLGVYISCESLEDGVYSLGCVPQYVMCIGRVGKLLTCPRGTLVFDEDTQDCKDPSKVTSCITGRLNELSEPVLPVTVVAHTVIPATVVAYQSDEIVDLTSEVKSVETDSAERQLLIETPEEVPVHTISPEITAPISSNIQNNPAPAVLVPSSAEDFEEVPVHIISPEITAPIPSDIQNNPAPAVLVPSSAEDFEEVPVHIISPEIAASIPSDIQNNPNSALLFSSERFEEAPRLVAPEVTAAPKLFVVHSSNNEEPPLVPLSSRSSEVALEIVPPTVSADSAVIGLTPEPPVSVTTSLPLANILGLPKVSPAVDPRESVPEVFTCSDKMDGIYARACSDYFVLCEGEKAIILRCPNGQVFDSKTSTCSERPSSCMPPVALRQTMDDLANLLPLKLEHKKEKLMLVYLLDNNKLLLATEAPLPASATAPSIPLGTLPPLPTVPPLDLSVAAVTPQTFVTPPVISAAAAVTLSPLNYAAAPVASAPVVTPPPIKCGALHVTPPPIIPPAAPVTLAPLNYAAAPVAHFATLPPAPIMFPAPVPLSPHNYGPALVAPSNLPVTSAPITSDAGGVVVDSDKVLSDPAYSAFSCRSHPDGVYPIPGSLSSIVLCKSGESVILNCPEDSVVDEKEMRCTVKRVKIRSKRYTMYDWGLETPFDVYPACYGMDYGVFSYGCSSTYYVSLPRYCNRFVCPPRLVFNTVTQRCTSAAYVPACAK